MYEEVRFTLDSPQEGNGFEPSVPREARGVFVSRGPTFPSPGNQAEATWDALETLIASRGTNGSNPLPSSGESGANWAAPGRSKQQLLRFDPRLSARSSCFHRGRIESLLPFVPNPSDVTQCDPKGRKLAPRFPCQLVQILFPLVEPPQQVLPDRHSFGPDRLRSGTGYLKED